MSSSQIGKMFYGVMKGSRASWNCWIELHCSVALLLWGSRSQVSYVCPWKFSIFFFTITGGKIETNIYQTWREKNIYLNLRNNCIYLWTGDHISLQVVFQTASFLGPSMSLQLLLLPDVLSFCFVPGVFLLFLGDCIHVKSSLLLFNKYSATLLFLTSVDCYINLYQTCLLHILLLLNVFSSPYWDQALWNQTIFHFP